MIATGHNGVGALIGLSIVSLEETFPNSGPMVFLLSLISGIVFHYLADIIPHGHVFGSEIRKKLREILIYDLFGSFLIIAIVSYSSFGFSNPFWVIMFAILGSQLPDVLGALEYLGKIPVNGVLKLEYFLHQNIAHWHGTGEKGLPWRWFDIWQIALYATSIIAVIYFPH